jgi:hypothetical protein
VSRRSAEVLRESHAELIRKYNTLKRRYFAAIVADRKRAIAIVETEKSRSECIRKIRALPIHVVAIRNKK